MLTNLARIAMCGLLAAVSTRTPGPRAIVPRGPVPPHAVAYSPHPAPAQPNVSLTDRLGLTLPWSVREGRGRPGISTHGDMQRLLAPAPFSFEDSCCELYGISLEQAVRSTPALPWLVGDADLSRFRRYVAHDPDPEWRYHWVRGLLGVKAAPPREFDGKAGGQLSGVLGSLRSHLQFETAPETAHVPGAERWQAEEALHVPVAGPLYVFGQVRAGYDTWTAQQMSMTGRTGVGCKLRPIEKSEVVLSGASVMHYAEDPLRPERLPSEKSQMVVELQARYQLLGPLKVEYDGTALPALTPLDRHRLNQDVRFAIPLGNAGQIRLGARHAWEEQPVPRPWTEGMQLYLGVGLKR